MISGLTRATVLIDFRLQVCDLLFLGRRGDVMVTNSSAWKPSLVVSRFVRKVRAASGAVAVQIVTRRGREIERVEHLGWAHTDAEPALLLTAARERLSPGQEPVGRMGKPEEIAAVLRLCSDAAVGMLSTGNLNAIEDGGLRLSSVPDPKAPYDLAEHFTRHGDYFTDGQILESTRAIGSGKPEQERRVVYQ
jgi:hypothetical protein